MLKVLIKVLATSLNVSQVITSEIMLTGFYEWRHVVAWRLRHIHSFITSTGLYCMSHPLSVVLL